MLKCAQMNHENQNSNLEKQIVAAEEKIAHLSSLIEKTEKLISDQEEGLKNLNEIQVIVNGLYEKAKMLAEALKVKYTQMPSSDEEWTAWEQEGNKIDQLYALIERLEEEGDQIMKLMDEVAAESDGVFDENV